MIDVQLDQKSVDRIKTKLKNVDAKSASGSINKGIRAASIFVYKILQMNLSGIILHRRTGNLAMTAGMRVDDSRGYWAGTIGSGAQVQDPRINNGSLNRNADKSMRMVYADILENGGVITPTGGRRFLTIPTKYAKTPSGVARFTANDVRHGGFGYDKTVIVFPYIMGVRGKKLTPLFKLQSSVRIPAFRYLAKTVETSASGNRLGNLMADEVEKEIDK